jgi:hypothetical protein
VVADSAQIVPDNVDDRPPPNTPKQWLVPSLNRREIILAVITAHLFVAAIILWVVFATMEEDPIASAFPTQSPTVSPRYAVRELQPIALPPAVSPQPYCHSRHRHRHRIRIQRFSRQLRLDQREYHQQVHRTILPDSLSFSPTAEPTFSQEISVNIVFNQRFQIGNELEFNETEQDWFCQTIYR